ncbi:MAG: hypothetical protein Q4B50_03365, partial [Bacillota bacterium]|nr:hypothetical protein [Bacillota bacterium]
MLYAKISNDINEETGNPDEVRKNLEARYSQKPPLPPEILQRAGATKKSLSRQERERQEELSRQARTQIIDYFSLYFIKYSWTNTIKPAQRITSDAAMLLGHPDFFNLKEEDVKTIITNYLPHPEEYYEMNPRYKKKGGKSRQEKTEKKDTSDVSKGMSELPEKISLTEEQNKVKPSSAEELLISTVLTTDQEEELKKDIHLSHDLLFGALLIAAENAVREMLPKLEEMDDEFLVNNAEKILI